MARRHKSLSCDARDENAIARQLSTTYKKPRLPPTPARPRRQGTRSVSQISRILNAEAHENFDLGLTTRNMVAYEAVSIYSRRQDPPWFRYICDSLSICTHWNEAPGDKDAHLRNSIKVRFVNTILVESQSSIPAGIIMENKTSQSLHETGVPRLTCQSFSFSMSTAAEGVNLVGHA